MKTLTAMEKKIEAPTPQQERELESVVSDAPDFCELRGRKIAVRWMRRGTLRKLSSVLNAGACDEDKVSCKCAAAIRLNGYWKIRLFYWLAWRWNYYVMQYSDAELLPLVALAKKKLPAQEYFLVTTFLTAMRDTMMTMTRKEADAIRLALSTERPSSSASARNGSQNPSDSAA